MSIKPLPIRAKFGDEFFAESEYQLKVSPDTKRLWAVVLDLFLEFDRVCKKHGIRYCLGGGSVLGAMRHGGFIPWDDDMDIAMTRDEYNKLCLIAPDEFKHPYFFQTNETDPGSARGHAQLRNSLTTAILKGESCGGRAIYNYNQGVFLDIMPHDVVPNDPDEREAFICEIEKIKARISRYKYYGAMWNRYGLHAPWNATKFRMLYYRLKAWITRHDLLAEACNDLDQVCRRYNNTDNTLMSDISTFPELARKRFLYRDMYEELTDAQYCGMTVKIPKRYDEYLTACYGDWHKHVVGGAYHGGLIIDLERPYTEYF